MGEVLKYLSLFSTNRDALLLIKPKSIRLSAILLVIKVILATLSNVIFPSIIEFVKEWHLFVVF